MNKACFQMSGMKVKRLCAVASLLMIALHVSPIDAQPRQLDPVQIGDHPPTMTPSESPRTAEPGQDRGEKEAGRQPTAADGPGFRVSAIVIEYLLDHPDHLSTENLMQTPVSLARLNGGLGVRREGVPSRTFVLSGLARPDEPSPWLYWSGIQHICEQVVQTLNDHGLIGVFVGPDPQQIQVVFDPATRLPMGGRDLRPAGDQTLRLLVRTATVADVRTVGYGHVVPEDQRQNHPRHDRIRRLSPLRSDGLQADGQTRQDLLRKDLLDDYILRLNRHPGRRVDVAVSAGERVELGEAVLDFLVAEEKPWLTYFQLSNTGTEHTREWRQRFGFTHSQLTGNDDIFSIDYITSGFDRSHAVLPSYEAPVFDAQRLRWRVYGSFSQYTAADVGLAGQHFKGESASAGGELIYNIFQHRDLFVDIFAGIRWEDIQVMNHTIDHGGHTRFLLPSAGIQLERYQLASSLQAAVTIERNLPRAAGTNMAELERLGRMDVADNWAALQWDFSGSWYLEPMLNRKAWEDMQTPESSTLAHELALTFRGQHTFGDRVAPQFQRTAGGFFTVRGYPESYAASDTALIANAEYRFHLPRIFAINPDPEHRLFGQPFRLAPDQVYGRPDWDLIFRGFFDVGHMIDHQEKDHTLLGAGLGVEWQLKRNASVRVDWGFALDDADVNNRQVTAGSSQVHIMATFLY